MTPKVTFIFALSLILGLALGQVAWNNANGTWKTTPKLVVSSDVATDSTFLKYSNLWVASTADKLALLSYSTTSPDSATQRNIATSNLTFDAKKDSNHTDPVNSNNYLWAEGLGSWWFGGSIVDSNGIQQVNIMKSTFDGAAPQSIVLTKNTNKTLTYDIKQIFTQQKRVYIVYGTGNATINIASIDGVTTTDFDTVVLTNNATNDTNVSCAGLPNQDKAFCIWTEARNSSSDPTILAEAIVTLVQSNTIPTPQELVGGHPSSQTKNYYAQAFSAGNQYGGLVKMDNQWLILNQKKDMIFDFTSKLNNISFPYATYPYYNKLIIVWKQIQELADGTKIHNFTLQYADPAAKVLETTTTLWINATTTDITQTINGSIYTVGGNSTQLYVGQICGDTDLANPAGNATNNSSSNTSTNSTPNGGGGTPGVLPGKSGLATQTIFATVVAIIAALFAL